MMHGMKLAKLMRHDSDVQVRVPVHRVKKVGREVLIGRVTRLDREGRLVWATVESEGKSYRFRAQEISTVKQKRKKAA